MMRIRLTAVVVCLLFMAVTYWLARRKRMKKGYAVLWLGTATAIAAVALVPGLLEFLSRVTGLYYLTALLLVVFLFLMGLFLHFSTVISALVYQNRMLAQRLAMLEERVKEGISG